MGRDRDRDQSRDGGRSLVDVVDSLARTWRSFAVLLSTFNGLFGLLCTVLIGLLAAACFLARICVPLIHYTITGFVVLARRASAWLKLLSCRSSTRRALTIVHTFCLQPIYEFFARLTRLRRWCMSENALRLVPADIAHMRELCEVDLSKNFIQRVHANIRQCTLLQKLDLSVNPIGRLPEQICDLRRLTHLKLNEVEIAQLPAHIGDMRNLVVLELRENRLETVPDSLCTLDRLESLDLGANQLRSLPQQIGALSSLIEFFVDSNCLSALPDSIGELRNLMQLDASSNELRSLPSYIGRLSSLVELNLADNRLSELPASIGSLRRLSTLKLEHNRLHSLPSEFGSCFALRELVLTENRLTELPPTVRGLCLLANLSIDRNRLQLLPNSICECRKLELLSVAENQLVCLPCDIGTLARLHVLNLAGNRLTWLPASLERLYELKACWLSEHQTAPLVPFEHIILHDVGEVLTCHLLPQVASRQTHEDDISGNGNANGNGNGNGNANSTSNTNDQHRPVAKRESLTSNSGKKKSLRFVYEPQIVREHRALNRQCSPHPSQLRDQQLLLMRAHAHSVRRAQNAANRLPSVSADDDADTDGRAKPHASVDHAARKDDDAKSAGQNSVLSATANCRTRAVHWRTESRRLQCADSRTLLDSGCPRVRSLSFDTAISALELFSRANADADVDLDVSLARHRRNSSAPDLPRCSITNRPAAIASNADADADADARHAAPSLTDVQVLKQRKLNCDADMAIAIAIASKAERTLRQKELDDTKLSEIDESSTTRYEDRNNNEALLDSVTLSSFSTENDDTHLHSNRRRRVGFADSDELDSDSKSRLRRRDTPHHTKHCRIAPQLPASEAEKVREVVSRAFDSTEPRDMVEYPLRNSGTLASSSKLPPTCPLTIDVDVEEEVNIRNRSSRFPSTCNAPLPPDRVPMDEPDRRRRRPVDSDSPSAQPSVSHSASRKDKDKNKKKRDKDKVKEKKDKSKLASGISSPARAPAPTSLLPQSNSLQSLTVTSNASHSISRITDGACEFITIEMHKPPDGALGISIQGSSSASHRPDSGVYVYVVQPDSAGERAGLRVGDKLLSINNVSCSGRTHQEIASSLKASGPVISLQVSRARSTPMPFADAPLAAASAESPFLKSGSTSSHRAGSGSAARSSSHSRAANEAVSRGMLRAVSISMSGDGGLNAPPTTSNACAYTPNSDSGVPPSGAASLCSAECQFGGAEDGEMITGVIKRDQNGGLGLSVIQGDERLARDYGLVNGAFYVSKIARNGATDRCHKFHLGDRIVAINQVDVTRSNLDQISSLLTGLEPLVRVTVFRSRAPVPLAALESQIVPTQHSSASSSSLFGALPSRTQSTVDVPSSIVRSPSSAFKPISVPQAAPQKRPAIAQTTSDFQRETVVIRKIPKASIGMSIIGGADKTCQPFGPPYSGVYVSRVARNSPAAGAKLRVGDLLMAVNEVDLRNATHDMAKALLLSLHPHSEIHLTVEHRPLPTGFRELIINKSSSERLGMSIKGGSGERGVNPLDPDDEGIFVWRVQPGCAIHRDGQLTIGTRLLEVNEETLIGVRHAEAVQILKSATSPIRLLVCDGIDPSALVDDDADDQPLAASMTSSVASSHHSTRSAILGGVNASHSPSSLSSVSIEVANYSLSNSGDTELHRVSLARKLPNVNGGTVLPSTLQLTNQLANNSGNASVQWQPVFIVMPIGSQTQSNSASPLTATANEQPHAGYVPHAASVNGTASRATFSTVAPLADCPDTAAPTSGSASASFDERHSSASSSSSVIKRRNQQVVTAAIVHQEASHDSKSPGLPRKSADEAIALAKQKQAARSASRVRQQSETETRTNGRFISATNCDAQPHVQFASVRHADTFSTPSTAASAVSRKPHAVSIER